jgi:hypothetical protein
LDRIALTLQKSIDFTPLEPSAGPTGGEGEAWPAPTMSLTIWSVWIALRAMIVVGMCIERVDWFAPACDLPYLDVGELFVVSA